MTDEATEAIKPIEERKEKEGALLFTGQLFRRRRGKLYRFTDKPPEPPSEPVCRPARVTQMLAFAHGLRAAIDRGEFRDQAEAARPFQLTRARVTQLMNLTLLAPHIQEQELFLVAVDGPEPMSERDSRAVVAAGDWAEQRDAWDSTLPASRRAT